MDSFEEMPLFRIDNEPSPPDSLFDFGIYTTRQGDAVSSYLPLTPISPDRPGTPKPKGTTPIIPLERTGNVSMETNTSHENPTTSTPYPPGDTPFVVEPSMDWLEERFRYGGPISNFQPANLAIPTSPPAKKIHLFNEIEKDLPPLELFDVEQELTKLLDSDNYLADTSSFALEDPNPKKEVSMSDIYNPPLRNAFGKPVEEVRPPQAETPIYDPRATFCRSCGKNFFEIAAECTQSWIAWTSHMGESQRDRDLRASTFLYGIETGVLLFSSPGLSQCPPCAGGFSRQNTTTSSFQGSISFVR